MVKRAIGIALAFIGLVVGAGFASGQEISQYFVAFGLSGVWGAVIAGVVMAAAGLATLELGSYFQAKEHRFVLDRVTHPILSRFFDASIMFTLFFTGVIMIAGAGANLQQQFGLPIIVGALIMVGMVILAGFLDVDKVTRLIGAITPLVIIFLVSVAIYSIVTATESVSALTPVAHATVHTSLPHWSISALNYVGMEFIIAVSMAIVMGGDFVDPRSAGLGGLLGGIVFGILLALSALGLIYAVRDTAGYDMPTLQMVELVSPKLAVVVALIIFGMIFNTAIGMFYAFAKRASSSKPERFRPILIVTTLVAFGVSFIGFKKLIAIFYPIIGYIGIVLSAVMVYAWLRQRSNISDEAERRGRIRALVARKLNPGLRFGRKHAAALKRALSRSPIKDQDLSDSIHDEVAQELASDDAVDFSEEDAAKYSTEDKDSKPEEAPAKPSEQSGGSTAQ